MAAKVLKCPACNEDITVTNNYQAEFVNIPQLGGPPMREMVKEEVTLCCGACGWSERTGNWRAFIRVPPQPESP
ncbi:hypothetical protein [Polyangium aurulentum]|uniref:hypothetical protein n=1 Tax=Polyangium aurulentum TaxID=2567896 RepID=UPI0010AEA199|nr:hypothetical protein [Polyangium aurulentum]UQA58768.1 hypothetical protein E8A73_047345 [Polyangium aurulentum]